MPLLNKDPLHCLYNYPLRNPTINRMLRVLGGDGGGGGHMFVALPVTFFKSSGNLTENNKIEENQSSRVFLKIHGGVVLSNNL